MKKTTISAVVSVYNREDLLPKVLQSLTWVDELIVIDNGSIDGSLNIARQYTEKIYKFSNNVMLNVNKNKGIEKASSEWILYLDDDEVIPFDLREEIRKVITHSNDIQGYWIPRKNIIFGKWIKHGIWWPDKQMRLFRKNKGKYALKHIHEYIQIDGKVSSLENSYIHHNYDSINQFLRKLNTLYTENEAEILEKSGYQINWQDAIKFPVSDFIKIYFAQSGYKDGLHGLVLAIFQAIYSFVIFAKLWEKKQFIEVNIPYIAIEKEFKNVSKEIRYWRVTTLINSSKNIFEQIYFRVLRKFNKYD